MFFEEVHCKIFDDEKNEEYDSIFLDVDQCKIFEENMIILSLKEFLNNAQHLRTYLEEKVDGEKRLISVHAFMDSSLLTVALG